MKRLLLLVFAVLPLSGCASLLGAETLDFDCSPQQLLPYTVPYAEHELIGQIHRDVGEDTGGSSGSAALIESAKSLPASKANDPIYQSLVGGDGLIETDKDDIRRMLLLSGGGQWGAFGAGFLKALQKSKNHRLPHFQVVTGVSTGAIQALFVAADALRELEDEYTSPEALAVPHKTLFTLRHGYENDTAPLRRRLESLLCNEQDCDLLERIGRSATDVYIGMVESRTGDFKVIAISRMIRDAAKVETGRRNEALHRAGRCVAAVTMASAAVPVQLRPVRLTSGGSNPRTYADGGVRLSVFEANMASIAEQASANGRKVELYVMRNGPTVVMPDRDKDPAQPAPVDRKPTVMALGKISYATLVNQNEVMSIAALRLLHPTGKILVATADGYATPYLGPKRDRRITPVCTRDASLAFEHQFMVCLAAWGEEKASRHPEPWIDLNPIITASKTPAGKAN